MIKDEVTKTQGPHDTEATRSLPQEIHDYPDSGKENQDDPSVGYEILEQRGKRHEHGGTLKLWIRIGINDPYADNTQYPLEWFCEQYAVTTSQCLRLTSYHNFPERDTGNSIIEYDLVIIKTPSRIIVRPYESNEAVRQHNEKVKTR